MNSYFQILKIVLHGPTMVKIMVATVLSFAFSIFVILSTFGLMDGFENLLRSSLKNATGELVLSSRKGHFKINDKFRQKILSTGVESFSQILQTEAFSLANGEAKGVVVRGVDPVSFSEVTSFSLSLAPGEINLGEQLATFLSVHEGETLSLMFGRGLESASALPMVRQFKVSKIVKHGIYLKDLRYVYLDINDLSEILQARDQVNFLYLKTQPDKISQVEDLLKSGLEPVFKIRPYWNEYAYLLEAVKIEKTSITLILQLIVLVAVFNILGFILFVMEKKAQEFFLLRTLGLNFKALNRFWLLTLFYMWAIACLISLVFCFILNFSLQNLSYFQIPGEIYVLSRLSIDLSPLNMSTVFLLSLVWILISAFIGYIRLRKKSLMTGLRQEFS